MENTASHRFEIRLPAILAERLDQWRRDQPDLPSRAEASRRIMALGLATLDVHAPADPLVG